MRCCGKRSPEEGDKPETRRPSGKFVCVFISVRNNIFRVSEKQLHEQKIEIVTSEQFGNINKKF